MGEEKMMEVEHEEKLKEKEVLTIGEEEAEIPNMLSRNP